MAGLGTFCISVLIIVTEGSMQDVAHSAGSRAVYANIILIIV